MYGIIAHKVDIKGEGPHFYIWDNSAGVKIPITVPNGTYYVMEPTTTGPSLVSSNTLAGVLNNLLSTYGISLVEETAVGDGPTWWRNVRLKVTCTDVNDWIALEPSEDADVIGYALGWYNSNGVVDTTTSLYNGDYLNPSVLVWRYSGGLLYDHAYDGFPEFSEERHILESGGVAVVASKSIKKMDVQITKVVRDMVINDVMRSRNLPVTVNDWQTVGLSDFYRPDLVNPQIVMAWGNADDSELYQIEAGGFANPLVGSDVRPIKQDWLGFYDINLSLYDVKRI